MMKSSRLFLLLLYAAVASVKASSLTCTGDVNILEKQKVQRWPHGIVPYTISEHVPEPMRTKLLSTLHRWENSSCANVFLPQSTEENYVSFEIGEKCCSYVGFIGRGKQSVLLNASCIDEGSEQTLYDVIQLLIGSSKQAGWVNDVVDEDGSSRHNNDQESGTHDISRFNHKCRKTCGGYAVLDSSTNQIQHFLRTPQHPLHYQPHLDCVWKLEAPEGYALNLTFRDLDVENHKGCSYDFVSIKYFNRKGKLLRSLLLCGSPDLEKLNKDGRAVHYNTSMVVIHFHSDSTYHGRGLLLGYQIRDKRANVTDPCSDGNGGCAHECTSDYFGDYVCSCRPGYRLTRKGRCLDKNECKENNGGCEHKCRNTEGSFLCDCRIGYGLSPDQTSCHSCGSHHNESYGTLYSPGFPIYLHNQNCRWVLHRWPNHHLKITIRNFDVEYSENCRKNFLKLQRGNFPNQRRLCGFHSHIEYYIQESTYIRFRSRTNNHHSGFMLSFKQVDSSELDDIDLSYVKIDNKNVLYSKKLWIS